MKTPFTDASTLTVHAGGKAFQVVPASVAQMIERRLMTTENAQNMAWGIIVMADWKSQTDQWCKAARNWQENIYVQQELPLTFAAAIPRETHSQPKSLPDALKLIAELRAENQQIDIRMNQLNNELTILENAFEEIESKYHEAIRTSRALHSN